MSLGYMRYCTEYVPLGKGISVYTPDRFFAHGVAEALSTDRRLRALPSPHPVSVIHFPDYCSLLAWSRYPTLPGGLTIIAGNAGITACLAPLFDPAQVGFVDTCRPAVVLPSAILDLSARCSLRPVPVVNEITLTASEMAFMWCWSAGRRPEGESKYNSRLKSQVMKKLAVGTDVALLIRFRLMFLLSGARCLLRCRIQNTGRGADRPSVPTGQDTFQLMVMV